MTKALTSFTIDQVACDGCSLTYVFKKPLTVEASAYEEDKDFPGYLFRDVWFKDFPSMKGTQEKADELVFTLGSSLCAVVHGLEESEHQEDFKALIKEMYYEASNDIVRVEGRKVYLEF